MESPQKTFLNFRNNLLMLYKNLPEDKIRHVMRVRFWLDYIAATKFLLSGHPKNAKAVYDARKEFFSLKNSYLSIGKENHKTTILKKIPELMQQSLILQFYLKGKKTYHQLVD